MGHFDLFRNVPTLRKYFGVLGLFLQQIVILDIVFGFVFFNSTWEHRLNVFVNIFYFFKKCTRSVNNFRTKDLFEMFVDLGS